MTGPWQTFVGKGGIGTGKLRIAVRRQVNRVKGLIIQRVRKGQCHGSYFIIPVIAYVRRAWHNAATDFSYRILGRATR